MPCCYCTIVSFLWSFSRGSGLRVSHNLVSRENQYKIALFVVKVTAATDKHYVQVYILTGHLMITDSIESFTTERLSSGSCG